MVLLRGAAHISLFQFVPDDTASICFIDWRCSDPCIAVPFYEVALQPGKLDKMNMYGTPLKICRIDEVQCNSMNSCEFR